MSWQDQVAGGSPRNNTPYVLVGQYVVDVEVVKYVNGFKGESFVIEQKVVESNVPERPPGMLMADIYNFKHEPAQDDVLTFLMKALGDVPKVKVTKPVIDAVVGEKNPLRGTRLVLSAYNKPTRAGKDFTACRYEFVAKGKDVAANPTIGLGKLPDAPAADPPPIEPAPDDDIPF